MMKVMKKVGALMLAVIMTLSLAMPYVGTVEAATDDTSSTWIKGSSSTVSGNQEDGYTLSMTGTSGWSSYSEMSAYKETNIKINNLKVTLDLSTFDEGQEFMLMFSSDGRHGIRAWDGKFVLFMLKRTAEDKLQFYGHNGEAVGDTTAFEYDFSKPLKFEFKQDGAGKWQPAINGVIYPMGDATNNSTNVFVNNLLTTPPNPLYVGFMAYSSTAVAINNIKFTDKTVVEEPEISTDLTGWSVGTDSTVTGNATDGFTLNMNGWGIMGAAVGNFYEANLGLSELEVQLDLSTVDTGKNIYVSFGTEANNLSGTAWREAKTTVMFNFQKTSDNKLSFRAHTGSADWGIKTLDIDVTTTSIKFTFVQDNGEWKPAINGQIISEAGQCDANDKYTNSASQSVNYETLDSVIDNILTVSANKTIVGFASQGNQTDVKIKNVKFARKVVDTTDLTGWSVGSDSTVTGNATDGFTLNMNGWGIMGAAVGNFYEANLGLSDLEVQLDLSTVDAGKNIYVSFGTEANNLSGTAWREAKTTVMFNFQKTSDNKLSFRAHTGSADWGIKTLDIDVTTTPIKFTFVQDNGEWKPAINGQIISEAAQCDANDKYTNSASQSVNYETLDSIIDNILTVSANKTTVGFASQGNQTDVKIKNVKFVQKEIVIPEPIGWDRGVNSSITGTPEEGWNLSVSGNIFEGSQYGSYYTSNVPVSKLQVTFDFSELPTGEDTWLVFSNATGTPGAWSETKASFYMKKVNDTRLDFVGHTSSAFVGQYSQISFDFSKSHVFTFAKDGEIWKPCIDGILYEIDCTEFINGMLNASPDKTVVGFAAQDNNALVIKNITFTEKENEIDWQRSKEVSITGDRGAGYDISGPAYTVARYLNKLKPQDTTLSFKLNSLGPEGKQTNVIILSEDPSMGLLPNAEQMKEAKGMVLLFEQKLNETYIQYWDDGHKDKVLFLAKYDNFDYDATHTITFKNEKGNWYLVLDGNVLRSYQLNHIVENMLTAEDGVFYRFTGWANDFSFEDIKFAYTPTDSSETSNWNVVGYEMSGKGDNLSFKGRGYASWKKPIDLTKTTIETQFKPSNGGWVQITVGDTPTLGATILPGLVLPEDEAVAISILFGRQNENELRLSLFGITEDGKKSERLITLIKNFDFDAVHKINFVEKNGNYHIAIDGQIFEWPNHDGKNKYVTKAFNDCLKQVSTGAYLRFLDEQAYGAEWNSISFVNEPFAEADIFVDDNVKVSQGKNGLSVVGTGTLGINKKFDIKNDKISVKFKPPIDTWVAMTIGDTASPSVNFFVGTGNEHNIMTILLARQKNGILRISLLDQGQEKLFMAISRFDFEATHTFSFVEHRGKYYLAIDDRMIEAVVHDGDDELVTTWVTKCVNALAKKGAYVRFVSPYGDMELSNVFFKGMENININGVTTKYTGSPATGDVTTYQPLVCAIVLSGSAIAAVGVQKFARRKKEK